MKLIKEIQIKAIGGYLSSPKKHANNKMCYWSRMLRISKLQELRSCPSSGLFSPFLEIDAKERIENVDEVLYTETSIEALSKINTKH